MVPAERGLSKVVRGSPCSAGTYIALIPPVGQSPDDCPDALRVQSTRCPRPGPSLQAPDLQGAQPVPRRRQLGGLEQALHELAGVPLRTMSGPRARPGARALLPHEISRGLEE